MIDPTKMKLGKKEYVHSDKTLLLAPFIADVSYPKEFNFDHNRASFSNNVWGNDAWGDCVKAGQTNHLLRLERVETRQTPKITDDDVVAEYKAESQREFGHAPQSPGDLYDDGLVVLYNLKNWRRVGWKLANGHTYTIDAFGLLRTGDVEQAKQASYLLHGTQHGLSLPRTAMDQVKDRVWDDTGSTLPDAEPGSWGGHLVYSKRYDEKGIYVKTWGMEILMTPAFIKRYCDEQWAVIDNLDTWRPTQAIDVSALEAKMRSLGINPRQQ
jgi:hypothetical protein